MIFDSVSAAIARRGVLTTLVSRQSFLYPALIGQFHLGWVYLILRNESAWCVEY